AGWQPAGAHLTPHRTRCRRRARRFRPGRPTPDRRARQGAAPDPDSMSPRYRSRRRRSWPAAALCAVLCASFLSLAAERAFTAFPGGGGTGPHPPPPFAPPPIAVPATAPHPSRSGTIVLQIVNGPSRVRIRLGTADGRTLARADADARGVVVLPAAPGPLVL